MIKYVCDMCGKPLLENEDVRYVVKIEVYAAYESSDSSDDYDDLDAVEDMIEGEDSDAAPGDDDSFATMRFDLCPECHKRYLQDPLFRKTNRRLGFSEN